LDDEEFTQAELKLAYNVQKAEGGVTINRELSKGGYLVIETESVTMVVNLVM
jgi:hypothetical protein